ncbi:uncharacterized protein N7515_010402 [Penicillium bovifimosum]|uniref:Uncharacterized protein n=1 Tax=Penicillium bovifimosum TaxID=126998 RepID=A0A9W9GFA8_9EURO|nr:uncharacterized protein N7515_010402 [Penicillium bovifimosum]KAJ5118179.1 hypothetical protein N7515_010402 [Penicillium bovifimosum]
MEQIMSDRSSLFTSWETDEVDPDARRIAGIRERKCDIAASDTALKFDCSKADGLAIRIANTSERGAIHLLKIGEGRVRKGVGRGTGIKRQQ